MHIIHIINIYVYIIHIRYIYKYFVHSHVSICLVSLKFVLKEQVTNTATDDDDNSKFSSDEEESGKEMIKPKSNCLLSHLNFNLISVKPIPIFGLLLTKLGIATLQHFSNLFAIFGELLTGLSS